MAKKQTTKKSKAKAKASRKNINTKNFDEAARKWLHLLDDPCGADLARPCYGSSGTGYLARQKIVVQPPAAASDFLVEFTPGRGSIDMYRFGWAATTGTTLGNADVGGPGGFLDSGVVGRFRPAAACARVIYTGSEAIRRGIVAQYLSAGISMYQGEAILGTALQWSTSAPYSRRMGEVQHEIKWVPSAEDEMFTVPDGGGDEGPLSAREGEHNSLTTVVVNAEPGTYYLELVIVYEWQPREEHAGDRIVSTLAKPASRVPIQEILQKLGDISKWAVGSAVSSGTRMAGVIASQALPRLSYAAPMLLTV